MTDSWRPPGVLPSTLGSDYQKKMWRDRYGTRSTSPSPSMNYKQIAASDLWQKGIVSETQISEMLVEELAKLNEFEPSVRIDTPSFARLTLDQQLEVFRQLRDEVQAAPSNKQASAQRNFVDQLGAGAKNFGKGIFAPLKTAWDESNRVLDVLTPDWVQDTWQKKVSNPALKALSVGGEEAAAEWIYFTQKMIPGEQKFERRVEAWKKQQFGDAPKKWWQKLGKYYSPLYKAKSGFGSEGSEFYDPGFDVPMYVHLPLEIIFDPLNVVPIAAISKATKLTKMGRTYAAGEESLRRVKSAKEAADFEAKKVQVEGMNRRAEQEYEQSSWDEFVGLGANALLDLTRQKLGTTIDEPTGLTDVGTRAEAIAGEFLPEAFDPRDIDWNGILMGRGIRRFKKEPESPASAADEAKRAVEEGEYTREVQAALEKEVPRDEYGARIEEVPYLRGNPHAIRRPDLVDPLSDKDALWDIATQKKPDGSEWKEGDPEYLHPVNQAAMQAIWHGGLRPEELKNVKMLPFVNQLGVPGSIDPAKMGSLNPSITMKIGSTGKANNRRIFGGRRGEGVAFFQNWIFNERQKWATLNIKDLHIDPAKLEELTPDALKAYRESIGKGELNALDDVFWLFRDGKHIPYEATDFNKIYEEAAEAYGEEGVKLLDFYRKWGKETVKGQKGKGNNNFASVWRLNAASRWLDEVRKGGTRSTTEIQLSMGHESPAHTSRYMSYLQMKHASLADLWKTGGFLDDQLDSGVKLNKFFFAKFPAGAANQDARAELISDRSRWLVDNILGDINTGNAHLREGRTIGLYIPDGATDEAALLYAKMEELRHFWTGVLSHALDEKKLIKKPYGGTPEQIKSAADDVDIIEQWRQSFVDAARELSEKILETNDPILTEAFLNQAFEPFRAIERSIAGDQAVTQKFGKMVRGKPPHGLLSDLLPHDFIAGIQRVTRKEWHEASGQEVTVRTDKLVQTKAAKIARLSQADLDKMNKSLETRGQAIIPGTEKTAAGKPAKNPMKVFIGDSGLNWDTNRLNEQGVPYQLASKDARFDATGQLLPQFDIPTGYMIVRQGDIWDSANKVWKEDRRTYIVTEWVQDPETLSLSKVKIERLASEPARDGKIRWSKEPHTEYIDPWDLQDWRLSAPNPIPIHPGSSSIGELQNPGRALLTPNKVAQYFYMSGAFDMNNPWMTMRQIRARMSSTRPNRSTMDQGLDDLPAVPSDGRLRNSKLLERRPGREYVGAKSMWSWGESTPDNPGVQSELEDMITKNEAGYGWATVDEAIPELLTGKGDMQPPRGPGPSIRAGSGDEAGGWEIPDGYWRMQFGPEDNPIGLEYILKVPDAMQQPGKIFSGEGAAARFFRIGIDGGAGPTLPWLGKLQAPRGSQKWLRMVVPGTFGASRGGRLNWLYRIGKGQGQEAASTVKTRLEQTFAEAGILDDTFSGQNIQLRQENVMSHPDSKMRLSMYDAFEKQEPRIWVKGARERDIANYTFEQHLQYVGTFLETPRADLNTYYVMTPKLQRAWDEYHEVGMQLMNMFENSGFKRSDIMEDIPWKQEFVPLMVTSKMNKDPDFGPFIVGQLGGQRIGTKPTTFMERGYKNHLQGKMRQGRGLGYTPQDVYLNNPILALTRQVEQYYDYIMDNRYMDAFSSLGIKQTHKEMPRHLFEKVVKPYRLATTDAERAAIASKLTVNQEEAITKFYGVGWENIPMEDLEVQVQRFRNMASSSESPSLQAGLNYIVDDSPLKKMAFTEEDSRELMALGSDMINPVSTWLNRSSAFANAMRVFATGADLGVLFLHGLGSLMTMVSPTGFLPESITRAPKIPMAARAAWGKGAWNMGRAMMEQIAYGKGASTNLRREWYINTALEREEMRRYGVSFFRSTFTEDLPSMAIKVPGAGQDLLRKNPATVGKFARQVRPGVERVKDAITSPIDGFGFFLDVSKTEMWRAYKGMGVDSADDLSDLAASLNAIHGTINPNVAGIQQKQRVFESAFLLYAALYRRSAVALIKNVFSGMPESAGKIIGGARRGDLEGGLQAAGASMQARKFRRGPALHAVSGMIMSGVGLGLAAKWMMDQGHFEDNPDIFNAGSPDFMAIKFGNIRMGISTPFYTFARIGNEIVDQMKNDPKGFIPWESSDYPLLKWARSQTSPVTSLGWDLFTGKDFVGNPLHTADSGWEVQAIGDRVARTLVPFWIESQFHQGRSFRGSIGEFMGLRVSPQSAYGRLLTAKNAALVLSEDPEIVEWRKSQERQGLPISVGAAPRLLMSRLMKQSPELQALEAELKEDVEARGTDERKAQDAFIEEVRQNRIDADRMLSGVSENFLAGNLSGKGLRDAVSTIEIELRAANKQVAGDYPEVVARFDERRSERVNDPEAKYFVYDIAYDAYRQEVTNDPTLHDDYGNFDIDRFMTLQTQFRINLNDEGAWQYIQDINRERRMQPGLVGEYYLAKEKLGEYWRLHERVFGKGSQAAEMINVWRGIKTEDAKKVFEQRYPRVKILLRKLDYAQNRYRRANPDQDARLVKFYDYSALTPQGQVVEQQQLLMARMNPAAMLR